MRNEPGYSESSAEEELLIVGGGGDLRYTRNLRPVMSLSNSNRLTRSMDALALERSCASKQRGTGTVGACDATIGPVASVEVLPRAGGGDLRYTLNSRPVTSLSNSNRPPQSCPSKQRGDVEAVFLLPHSPWGRPLGDSSVVPVMLLDEMKRTT